MNENVSNQLFLFLKERDVVWQHLLQVKHILVCLLTQQSHCWCAFYRNKSMRMITLNLPYGNINDSLGCRVAQLCECGPWRCVHCTGIDWNVCSGQTQETKPQSLSGQIAEWIGYTHTMEYRAIIKRMSQIYTDWLSRTSRIYYEKERQGAEKRIKESPSFCEKN